MTRALLHRVGRALALTTVFTSLVWLPAAPAVADLADGDTTTTTLPSDPTTTTTTTDPSPTTTTTTPADPDPGSDTSTTSTSTTSTTTSGPVPSTTSTTLASSGPPGGSGRSTTTTRPSPTTTATAPSATTAPDPAFPPAGATVITDAAGDPPAGGDEPGTGGGAATPSAGSGRTPRPAPPDPGTKRSEAGEAVPDPNWFDASGLSGLLGVGSGLPPAAADAAAPAGDLQSALPSRDGNTRSPLLLALSLLIMLGLVGGVAYLWWDRRPTRYWAA